MPLPVILFLLLAAACCAYAVLYGGIAGRWAAFLMSSAIAASILVSLFEHSYRRTAFPLFYIELYLLFGLLILTFRSRRYWPIWMLAFQLLCVATHLATMAAPTFVPKVYQALADFWAIPMLLVMLFGAMMDRRLRA